MWRANFMIPEGLIINYPSRREPTIKLRDIVEIRLWFKKANRESVAKLNDRITGRGISQNLINWRIYPVYVGEYIDGVFIFLEGVIHGLIFLESALKSSVKFKKLFQGSQNPRYKPIRGHIHNPPRK